MTVVTGTFKGPTGVRASGAVMFVPCGPHIDDDSNDIIWDCAVTFQLVDGVLTTAELEPGCYTAIVAMDCKGCDPKRNYLVQVGTGPTDDFWEIIQQSIPLINAPVYVVSIAGLSGVISLAQLLAVLPADADISYTTDIGNGTTGPFAVTHNLGATEIGVVVRNLSDNAEEGVYWRVTGPNTISIEPDVVYALNSRRVYVFRVAP